MDSSGVNNELIERLLNVNKLSKNEQADSTAELGDAPFNFTPDQLEMLANYYGQNKESVGENSKNKSYKTFLPEPGFCLKTKTDKNEKIFLNICKSNEISSPRDISEEDLLKLIEKNESDNAAFHYRVPMSLGEAHSELDNSNEACSAYDICISPDFLKKILENATFMGFFMSIVIEGLEEKYKIKLDRNCKMLKNKKFMGKINEQHIRVQSKPLIAEMNDSGSQNDQENTLANQPERRKETPKYKIFREPTDGPIEFLVAEIELPKIISAKSLSLDIGEDRILLTTRSGLYHLDIFLSYQLNQSESGAQFDKKTKVLTITMPVVNV